MGYTDTETVKLDFDNTSFKQVNYWASRALKKYRLKGYLILKSSKSNYHVVFDRRVSWKKNISVVAWVSLYSQNRMLKNWLIMQCIKEESTLRISSKGDKLKPRIVLRHGEKNNQIRIFSHYRKLIRKMLKRISNEEC